MDKPRILIIDDDDLIAVALFQHLIANGLHVDIATEPRTAEVLLRKYRYALVVMDAYLTGLLHGGAADLLERVRALSADVPIVLLSAYGSEQLTQAVGRLKNIMIFSKPQSVVFLSNVIRGVVMNAAVHPANETP